MGSNIMLQTRQRLPGSEVLKLFSCSTQLSMKFSLLINMNIFTNIGIFIIYKQRKFHTQLN